MTSGFQGTQDFRSYDQEVISKPAISLNESWGGYRRMTQILTTSKLVPKKGFQ